TFVPRTAKLAFSRRPCRIRYGGAIATRAQGGIQSRVSRTVSSRRTWKALMTSRQSERRCSTSGNKAAGVPTSVMERRPSMTRTRLPLRCRADYAVAWSDFDGDGSDLGVALRQVNADGSLGPLR